MIYEKGRAWAARYYMGRATLYVYKKGRLAWEYIVGYIFSSDSFAVQTKDGYIIKCKDQ